MSSFESVRKAGQTSEIEQIACVAAICALASTPLLLSVALIVWGA